MHRNTPVVALYDSGSVAPRAQIKKTAVKTPTNFMYDTGIPTVCGLSQTPISHIVDKMAARNTKREMAVKNKYLPTHMVVAQARATKRGLNMTVTHK
mmetsp:Transcript_50047/g.57456  ORF Transcript_50047/g.57456 Transcript_50047/m.57456 type:complete len:97 (+) Transcript_50047:1281-1571(+)